MSVNEVRDERDKTCGVERKKSERRKRPAVVSQGGKAKQFYKIHKVDCPTRKKWRTQNFDKTDIARLADCVLYIFVFFFCYVFF